MFSAIAVDTMDDNASSSKITATSNNLLAIASARNTCYVAFQQIASKLLETEQNQYCHKGARKNFTNVGGLNFFTTIQGLKFAPFPWLTLTMFSFYENISFMFNSFKNFHFFKQFHFV